ncbi:MAG: ATP synthase subunit I [Peptococcaceae bacterium]|nr:ATP synthase subunit I [Peptococcaceae bacterium]
MDSRTLTMVLGFPISVILLGTVFSGNNNLLGLLIGYVTGIINIQWLFRDANQVIERDIKQALKKYYISLYSRLGMITMVVVMVAKFRPERLYFLVIGIIAGIFIPLVVIVYHYLKREGG